MFAFEFSRNYLTFCWCSGIICPCIKMFKGILDSCWIQRWYSKCSYFLLPKFSVKLYWFKLTLRLFVGAFKQWTQFCFQHNGRVKMISWPQQVQKGLATQIYLLCFFNSLKFNFFFRKMPIVFFLLTLTYASGCFFFFNKISWYTPWCIKRFCLRKPLRTLNCNGKYKWSQFTGTFFGLVQDQGYSSIKPWKLPCGHPN